MKVISKVFLVFSLIFLLTGCGKKLTCTQSTDNETMTVDFKFNSHNYLESGTLKFDFKLNDDQKADLETYKEAITKSFNEGNYKDLNVTVSDNKKDTITVKMSFDTNSLSKALNIEIKEAQATYNDLKKEITASGFTCK